MKVPAMASRVSLVSAAVAAAFTLSGCGHGHKNDAPTVGAVSDQSVFVDGSTSVPLTVSDDDTAADQLQIVAQTGDATIIPASGLTISGSGGSRVLTITPAAGATGSTTVAVIVTDAKGKFNKLTFKVDVTGTVLFSALVNTLYPQDVNANAQSLTNLTITYDVDDNPTAFDSLLQ